MLTGQEPTTPEAPQADAQQQTQTQPQAGHQVFDAEYVKQLRTEAANYRTKLAALEAKAKAEDDAKLSETEQLKKKLVDMETLHTKDAQERLERTTRYEVELAASKLNIVDPEAAYKLLDQSALEYSEDGTPKNIEAALKALVASKPYLVGVVSSGSAANPNSTKVGRLTMDEIKRMPQDEITRRWDEVSAVLSGGK